MSPSLFSSPWMLAAAALALLGVVLLVASLIALVQFRPLTLLLRLAAGCVALAGAALIAAVLVGTRGYQALTREAVAAQIRVEPIAPQRFRAHVRLADGREGTYDLAGDEIYVDAHILKWKPIANLAGLHTAYELDRIAGRYHALKDEKAGKRTVYELGADKPIDLFTLRRRYAFLEPLLDAEYGSASFVPVTRPAQFEVRVATSGVLIREVKP